MTSSDKMSKTVHITSTAQLSSLISSSTIVVADCKFDAPPPHHSVAYPPGITDTAAPKVYADWCGPCKQIAPIYEQLSVQLSRPSKITFAKVDVEKQQELAGAYGVNA